MRQSKVCTGLLRAFEKAASAISIGDEPDVLRTINFGMGLVLGGLPRRYLTMKGEEPMLWWWLGPILPSASRDLPYLRYEPGCTWTLACEADRCVGFACVDVDKHNIAHLRHDYVAPGQRRQGVGSELLRRRLEIGNAANVNGFRATCNKASIRIYEKAGFHEAGRRGSYIMVVRGTGMGGDACD